MNTAFGQCVRLPPKGTVAASLYRKVDEIIYLSAACPTRASLLGGLSRMMGNYQVRFLGGKGAARPLTYPVLTSIVIDEISIGVHLPKTG